MMRGQTTRQERGRFGFIKDTISELRKVIWPSRRETTHLTTIVIIVAVAVGLILGAIDLGFAKVMEGLLFGGP